MRRLTVLLSIVLLLAFTTPASAQTSTLTVTTTANLRLREGPATTTTYLLTIPYQTALTASGRNANATWVQVSYNGLTGWVSATYLIAHGSLATLPIIDPESGPAAPVDTTIPAPTESNITATPIANLRLRSGPGTNTDSLAIVPRGTSVPVLGRNANGTWAAVEYQGQRGWIAASWATFSQSLGLAAVVGDLASSSPPPDTTTPSASSTAGHQVNFTYDASSAQAIIARGQAMGRLPNRFSKISDGEGHSGHYLTGFDVNDYDLAAYSHLQSVVNTFSGSWVHMGPAVQANFQIHDWYFAEWSDPAICNPGEGPVVCEVRTWNPSVAMIYLRTKGWQPDYDTAYYPQLKELCEYLISQGVLPVLSTLPPIQYDDIMNPAIRQVAAELNLPLWDYAASIASLPNNGLSEDNVHLSASEPEWRIELTDAELSTYGIALRNLETLQVMQIIRDELLNTGANQ